MKNKFFKAQQLFSKEQCAYFKTKHYLQVIQLPSFTINVSSWAILLVLYSLKFLKILKTFNAKHGFAGQTLYVTNLGEKVSFFP